MSQPQEKGKATIYCYQCCEMTSQYNIRSTSELTYMQGMCYEELEDWYICTKCNEENLIKQTFDC